MGVSWFFRPFRKSNNASTPSVKRQTSGASSRLTFDALRQTGWGIVLGGILLCTLPTLYLLRSSHRVERLITQARINYPWLRSHYAPLAHDDQVNRVAVHLNPPKSSPATGPLRLNPQNTHYFMDDRGQAIYLTGAHTWSNLQDTGIADPPPVFDYGAYLDFLTDHHQNFFRLYIQEQTMGGPWLKAPIRFAPHPYVRSGPGLALDGKPKFDLAQFNQPFFDRMRQRVQQAGERGIYVSVMLFNGWSLDTKGLRTGNAWPGHPYNGQNNINGVDGDYNHDNEGTEIHTLVDPALTALQEAYVRKVIDTVNDLDNVVYEISNESNPDSTPWQYHLINFIKAYEASKPKQHPVGMTAQYLISNDYSALNQTLFASPADWISPANADGYQADPPIENHGKVIIADTDHLWGIGGDRTWVWKSFLRGVNPIFMDPYNCSPDWPPQDDCNPNDPTWVSLRRSLGYTRIFAQRMNLVALTPSYSLASTGYCLANAVADDATYLVYAPEGGEFKVDLAATTHELQVEWFDPETGASQLNGTIMGGGVHSFTSPLPGDALLYLHEKSGH